MGSSTLRRKIRGVDRAVFAELLVDEQDDDLLLAGWRLSPNGYAVRGTTPGPGARMNRRTVYLHRLIAERDGWVIPLGGVVDHINGNKTDNRRANLRVLSRGMNSMPNLPKWIPCDQCGKKAQDIPVCKGCAQTVCPKCADSHRCG